MTSIEESTIPNTAERRGAVLKGYLSYDLEKKEELYEKETGCVFAKCRHPVLRGHDGMGRYAY